MGGVTVCGEVNIVWAVLIAYGCGFMGVVNILCVGLIACGCG